MPDKESEEPSPKTSPRDGVPAELIDEVHKANEKFSAARRHIEKAIDAPDFDVQDRREKAAGEMLEAEKEAEALDEKVKPELGKTD